MNKPKIRLFQSPVAFPSSKEKTTMAEENVQGDLTHNVTVPVPSVSGEAKTLQDNFRRADDSLEKAFTRIKNDVILTGDPIQTLISWKDYARTAVQLMEGQIHMTPEDRNKKAIFCLQHLAPKQFANCIKANRYDSNSNYIRTPEDPPGNDLPLRVVIDRVTKHFKAAASHRAIFEYIVALKQSPTESLDMWLQRVLNMGELMNYDRNSTELLSCYINGIFIDDIRIGVKDCVGNLDEIVAKAHAIQARLNSEKSVVKNTPPIADPTDEKEINYIQNKRRFQPKQYYQVQGPKRQKLDDNQFQDKKGQIKKKIFKCFECKKLGHISKICPKITGRPLGKSVYNIYDEQENDWEIINETKEEHDGVVNMVSSDYDIEWDEELLPN
jgi:hypothetical protein